MRGKNLQINSYSYNIITLSFDQSIFLNPVELSIWREINNKYRVPKDLLNLVPREKSTSAMLSFL